jgi:hypothetical protein
LVNSRPRPGNPTLLETPGSADIAAIAEKGKRRASNAFLFPPTSWALFDALITNHFPSRSLSFVMRFAA